MRYISSSDSPDVILRERRERSKRLRAALAERVLLRGQVVKGAAFDMGIKLKVAEYHLARVRRIIREGTDRLLA